jgi:8-oxo-dGTP pyrophosphatase MutT (NUDIX family)
MMIDRFTILDDIPTTTTEALDPWFRRTVRAVVVYDDALVFSHMSNRNQYVLPGGGIEKGESPEACAQRECAEELGLKITAGPPLAMVREFYNGMLRFENLYVIGEFKGERTACKHTGEEDFLGITESWIPLSQVQQTLLETNAHTMDEEHQVEHVRRAIANCHMRELLGIASLLGWNTAPAIDSRCRIDGIAVWYDWIRADSMLPRFQ